MVSPNNKSREESNDQYHSTIHNAVSFLHLGENSTEMGSFYTYPSPKKQAKPKPIFIDLTDKTKLRNKAMFQNSNEDSKKYKWNNTLIPKRQTKPKAIFIDLTDKTKLKNSNEDSENDNWNATPKPKVEFRMPT